MPARHRTSPSHWRARSTSSPFGTDESPPRSKASRDEKRPERTRQQIEEDERWQKRRLLGQILAERGLAGQCSGRNLEENKNYDCRHHGHQSSQLQPVAKKITNRCAKR